MKSYFHVCRLREPSTKYMISNWPCAVKWKRHTSERFWHLRNVGAWIRYEQHVLFSVSLPLSMLWFYLSTCMSVCLLCLPVCLPACVLGEVPGVYLSVYLACLSVSCISALILHNTRTYINTSITCIHTHAHIHSVAPLARAAQSWPLMGHIYLRPCWTPLRIQSTSCSLILAPKRC
jgi:hypothetical protein